MSTTLKYVGEVPAQIYPELGTWELEEARVFADDEYAAAYLEAANQNHESPLLEVVAPDKAPPVVPPAPPPVVEPAKDPVKADVTKDTKSPADPNESAPKGDK